MTEPDQSPITVLLVEDNPADARLLQVALAEADKGGQFEVVYVDRLSAALDRLTRGGVDMVLLDLSLPDERGFETLATTHSHAPDVPIVVLTGLNDDALAVRAVRSGAQDYLVKGKTDGDMLVRAMRYAIERNRLMLELQETLARVKTLSGLLPICASCKNIRDDKGYWNQIEAYVEERSEAEFSHGICPNCAETLYPQLYDKAAPPLRECKSR